MPYGSVKASDAFCESFTFAMVDSLDNPSEPSLILMGTKPSGSSVEASSSLLSL